MTYVRIYAGPDGESHVQDVAVDMQVMEVFPGLPPLGVAACRRIGPGATQPG